MAGGMPVIKVNHCLVQAEEVLLPHEHVFTMAAMDAGRPT